MPENRIEPEFAEHYSRWSKVRSDDSDEARNSRADFLTALRPTIEGAIRTHVGEPDPLLLSKARQMTLHGLETYDPSRGRLQSHLYNHLQGLKRVARKQSTILNVPERISLERSHLENAGRELEHELGREPSTQELADRSGLSLKRITRVRSYHPAVSPGAFANAETGEEYDPETRSPLARDPIYHQLVYDELDPYHQKIMEHTLGMHGQPVLPNHKLAAKLKRTPGAISQAKMRIQTKLDEIQGLSEL